MLGNVQKERRYNTKKIFGNSLGEITCVLSEVGFDVGTTIYASAATPVTYIPGP